MNETQNALTTTLNEAGQLAAELTLNFSHHGDTMDNAEFLRYLLDWNIAFRDDYNRLDAEGKVKLAYELKDRLTREIETAKAYHKGEWKKPAAVQTASAAALIEKLRESLRAAAD